MPTLTNKGNFIIGTSSSATGTEYSPKSIKPGFESLASEESGRADDGTMNISWIKQIVRKIEIEMPPYTNDKASDMAALLQSIQGKDYYITYFDTLAGAQKTIHAYTSNSTTDCYSGVLYNGMWTGLTFSAIDMDGENYA